MSLIKHLLFSKLASSRIMFHRSNTLPFIRLNNTLGTVEHFFYRKVNKIKIPQLKLYCVGMANYHDDYKALRSWHAFKKLRQYCDMTRNDFMCHTTTEELYAWTLQDDTRFDLQGLSLEFTQPIIPYNDYCTLSKLFMLLNMSEAVEIRNKQYLVGAFLPGADIELDLYFETP